MRKVAVVGNSTLQITPDIGAEIVDVMVECGEVEFLTRGSPGFDEFAERVALLLGRKVIRYAAQGGSSNWLRDVEMVRAADEVLAFLDPDTLHREDTGTAHVIEKALDQKKKVSSYTVANGHLAFAGSNP
jgi:hypothetical protein